ncbi:MAG: pyridoxal-phosphate dependent enzyme, partial [Proteobacteria bacterium]
VGLELFEQARDLDASLDVVLAPCGGGGLTASVAVVARTLSPGTRVFAAEPQSFDDMRRSLEAARRVGNPVGQRTICDAIMTPMPTALTFPINLELLSGGLVASDDEVRTAMRFAYDHFKIVVEPGAAVGLAAILAGRLSIEGKTVATIATGGNIDLHRFHRLLA